MTITGPGFPWPAWRRRPNRLIITGDHLVEPAMEALAEPGDRVPDDLLVIGHWNYPLPYTGRTPVRLLGFVAREFLRAGLDVLQAMRASGAVPPPAAVPVGVAEELPAVHAPGPKTELQEASA